MKEITFGQAKQFSDAVTTRISLACRFLQETDLATQPEGKVEIQGDNVFAVFQRYHTASAECLEFEAHRKYIDLQYIISGKERILVSPLSELTEISVPYDEGGDILFFKDPQLYQSIDLQEGEYVIFEPEDGHKTRCDFVIGGCDIHKVIIKILK